MTDLIELLERFNRKERYFLICQTLGLPQMEFQLSDKLRETLECKINLPIRGDAFVAMDYHLDWIAASLRILNECIPMNEIPNRVFPDQNDKRVATGTQRDIDLLIAFTEEDSDTHHMVFIEAKAYGAWDSKQLRLKAERLRKIFGDNGRLHPKVHPEFFLISPNPPTKRLRTVGWPEWMKPCGEPRYLELAVLYPRYKVTRCDETGTNSDENGDFFKIDKIRNPSGNDS